MTYKCPYCGTMFSPATTWQQFCNPKCRRQYIRRYGKIDRKLYELMTSSEPLKTKEPVAEGEVPRMIDDERPTEDEAAETRKKWLDEQYGKK